MAALMASTVIGFSETKVRSTSGDVGGGDADGEAVELAGHLGDDQLEGLGGAGAGGDHGEGGGAGAAEVLVRRVEDDLIVGVAVDRGHDAGLDAEGVVEHLDDRARGSWWCSSRWR